MVNGIIIQEIGNGFLVTIPTRYHALHDTTFNMDAFGEVMKKVRGGTGDDILDSITSESTKETNKSSFDRVQMIMPGAYYFKTLNECFGFIVSTLDN